MLLELKTFIDKVDSATLTPIEGSNKTFLSLALARSYARLSITILGILEVIGRGRERVVEA